MGVIGYCRLLYEGFMLVLDINHTCIHVAAVRKGPNVDRGWQGPWRGVCTVRRAARMSGEMCATVFLRVNSGERQFACDSRLHFSYGKMKLCVRIWTPGDWGVRVFISLRYLFALLCLQVTHFRRFYISFCWYAEKGVAIYRCAPFFEAVAQSDPEWPSVAQYGPVRTSVAQYRPV